MCYPLTTWSFPHSNTVLVLQFLASTFSLDSLHSVCVRLGVFGDICEGELLMQCKSNLPHGRCAAFCLLCVRLCVCVYVCETLSERRKELCCN